MLALTLMMGNLWAQADADPPTTPESSSQPLDTAGEPSDPADEPVEEEPSFADLGGDSGDTAWMIVATALVLFMTIPGLALF